MLLFRRKSLDASLAQEIQIEEKEERRRGRLSKPRTNKSNGTPQVFPPQYTVNRSRTTTSSDDSMSPVVSPTAFDEPRELIKARIFDTELESGSSTGGVAMIISRFEASPAEHSPSPPLPSAAKAKRPLSAFFANRRFSSQHNKSQSSLVSMLRAEEMEGSLSSVSPALSSEGMVETPDVPVRRRASFAPGVVSRVPKIHFSPEPGSEAAIEKDEEHHYEQSRPEISPRSRSEALDVGQDAAQVVRSTTPVDLDVPHLGGLTPGTLHVVNGRASPAPSELSRHFLPTSTAHLRWDLSSEYAESVVDGVVPDDAPEVPRISIDDRPRPKYHIAELHQDPYFHTASNSQASPSSPCYPDPHSAGRTFSINRKPLQASNRASLIAESYMAELSVSPYSKPPSPSPRGSVLITTSKPTEVEDDLFDDEAVGGSESAKMDRVDSAATWYTPSDAAASDDDEDAFQSSVELQHHHSSQHLRQPLVDGECEKSDSGYSSIASEQFLTKGVHDSAERPGTARLPAQTSAELLAQPPEEHADPFSGGRYYAQYSAADQMSLRSQPGGRQNKRGFGPRPFRPSILKQKTAPELPTFTNLHPSISPLPSTASASTLMSSPQSPTKPKKLQKPRPVSRVGAPAGFIVVQGAHETDDLVIPSPTAAQIANLQIRHQQLPELERTFKSMHHSRKDSRSSLSTLIVFSNEIRFPSPTRSPDRSPGRDDSSDRELRPSARSSSRKRDSFLGRLKSERRQSQQRRYSGISESDAKAIIRDFGTVATSLGTSPYDIARAEGPQRLSMSVPPQSRNASFNMTPMAQMTPPAASARPMMDDRTASEFARWKSRSIHERDDQLQHAQRPAFNDRGGIPGRNWRPRSTAWDAPPLPPLPGHEASQQQAPWLENAPSENWSAEPGEEEQEYWNDDGEHEEHFDNAPPPPSHSPQPEFMEPEEYIPEPTEPPPPPPPSHSPRPLQVEPDPERVDEDVWATPAQAWKDRRRSLGEMLRRDHAPEFSHEDDVGFDEEAVADDAVYPIIPPRQPYSAYVPDTSYSAHPRPSFADERHEYYEPVQRPLPQPSAHSHHARPHSRVSQANSFASSLAEELHPERPDRPQLAPQFGRYSGGLSYGYEHGVGFGGSAGVRTTSGSVSALRKSVPLSTNYGIDLTDVPIIAGLKRISMAAERGE